LGDAKLDRVRLDRFPYRIHDNLQAESISSCSVKDIAAETGLERRPLCKLSVRFTPAVSNKTANAMRQELRRKWLWCRSDLTLDDLADYTCPILRSWVQYYRPLSRSVPAAGAAIR
jgi:hypothetical protein